MSRSSPTPRAPVDERLAELSPEKRKLLEAMVRSRATTSAIPKRGLHRAPLAFGQERLWFLNQLAPGESAYNLHFHMVFPKTLNVDAWKKAWTYLVERHEVLRTRFVTTNTGAEQVIDPPAAVELPEFDLTELEPHVRTTRAAAIAAEQAETPFDLSKDRLFRMALLRMPDKIIQVVTMHHIITDGWSSEIMTRDLNAAYAAVIAGTAPALPPLPIQYSDFAFWQREQLTREKIEPLLSHWRKELEGIVPLELPADRPRTAQFTGMAGVRARLLDNRLAQSLASFAQREGHTLYMALLAGFAALLHLYTGQEDMVFGTPVAGRDASQLEPLMGFFLNTILLRVPIDGHDSFRTLLSAVKEVTVRAYSNQQLPFASLVEELQPERDLSRSALYQVTFQLLQARNPAARASAVLDEIGYQKRSTDVDLAVDLIESGEGLLTRVEFSRDLFDESTIDRMLAHWERLISAVLSQPDTAIAELPLATPEERAMLIEDWSGMRDVPVLPALTLEAWFREAAARYSTRTAIIGPDGSLTYGELDSMTDRLAAAFARRGAGIGEIVGIYLANPVETIVCILASWKAGAAYVYLDRELPQQRLDELLAQCNPFVLVSDADSWWREAVAEPKPPGKLEHNAEALAAVIYTSGSTGQPKGVMLEQRSLLQQIAWFQRDLALTPDDRILQKYSFSFDAALAEVLNALACGAGIVISAARGHDLDELVSLIRTWHVTVLDVVPSTLAALLQCPEFHSCGSLRRLICGGERLSAMVVNRCRELLPQVEIINAYGPTETAITAAYSRCSPDTLTADPPLGRPVPGYEAYVLNSVLEPVPIGMRGELYLGGVGLARGYLGDDDLTSRQFVPHPFRPGNRLYRTGDRARYREDGTLEFLGRSDQQVKLRGFRIELEEIENVLREHPAVGDAAVVTAPLREPVFSDAERLVKRLEELPIAEAEFLVRLESGDQEVRRRTMQLKSPQFELYLQLLNDDFVRTPLDSQRNWLLRRALGELAHDLDALDKEAREMGAAGTRPEITGAWETDKASYSSTELLIDGQQVMHVWEEPLMAALAEVAAEAHGDVLEVGFGMGISAGFLQRRGVRSHTIIECNNDVRNRLEEWKRERPAADIRVISSRWQDWDAPESAFDAVLYDTYPTSEEEYLQEVVHSPVFAASFFPVASQLLRHAGVFTYYSNEIDSLSREHQRLLLRYFRSFSVSVVRGLKPPPGCQYWWADSMAVVRAVK